MQQSHHKPLLSLLSASLLVALSASAQAQEEVVNVYNWSDYIDESILEDFTEETGISVNYDVFDSNELVETKLLTGSTGYDIVVPTGSFLRRQIRAGVFQPLNYDALPNVQEHAWDVIEQRAQQFDADNIHSVNYMWGTTGLGYVKEKIDERMEDAPYDSLSLIFDPENAEKFADCGIHMLDAPTEIVPAALTYLGINPNSEAKEDLEKAEEVLVAIRPYVRKFHSSEYISALANGDICLAFGWSGDILQASDRAAEADNGVTVEYQIPKEGGLMWFDQMAIPTDAPNVENAHAFINYINRPEVMAKATNYINYSNGNEGSQAFIDESIINNPAIYPSAETIENLYTYKVDNPRYTRLLNRSWTRVKSGQ